MRGGCARGGARRRPSAIHGNRVKRRKTEVDGITFDSAKEAARYQELRLQERAGVICDLKVQQRFPLVVDGRPVLIRSKGYPNGRRSTWRADFTYYERGVYVVEDVKGIETDVQRYKRAFFEAMTGIRVRIV